MNKNSTNSVDPQISSRKYLLSATASHKMEANLEALHLSGFGGLPLLREEESSINLVSLLSSCIREKRDPQQVNYSLENLLRTRIYQITLGYEDGNDCTYMRNDPMMKLCADNTGTLGHLCSQPTMCRFENSVDEDDLERMRLMFINLFVWSYKKAPRHIILDCDDTNANTYGGQQLTLFNDYYGDYCYMPLLIFEGHSGKMIMPLLRPGRRNKSANVADTLIELIKILRVFWPLTHITVRGDSHFCSHEFMDWASPRKRVNFITGLSTNSRLKGMVKIYVDQAKSQYELFKTGRKIYASFMYKAQSWLFPQRVIAKIEMSEMGLNVRFIVTNIRGFDTPSLLYEKTYCGRGRDELFIKEYKLYLKSDRMSCNSFKANQFRLYLHAAAYLLFTSIRENALKGTSMEHASIQTIRERILLSAVCVRKMKTKIVLEYAVDHPAKPVMEHLLLYYELKGTA